MPDKQPPVPPPKPKMGIVQKEDVKVEQPKAKDETKPNFEAKPKVIKEEAKPIDQPKIKKEVKPKDEVKPKELPKTKDEPKLKEQPNNKQKEEATTKEPSKKNEAKEDLKDKQQSNANASVSPSKSSAETANVDPQQNEQDAKTQERQQQLKSLDALYAAAREEFDLDLSPTESAIKTLKEGREMQKLSVVRNLAELIEAEPAEAMRKVLPKIQDLLNVEPSNLDMHCEGAVVYKNCIKDQKLQRLWPDLPEQLLGAILENIERQKENVTAAAWLESLVDIADCVPQHCVVSMIVPVAISQADSARRVQRRVISTRLIERLATLVPREIVQRELSPCAQMLCQDPSTAVRTSIAQRLSVLAQALNNSTDCCALLLPCIIELCKDEDPAVREAILSSLDVCLPYFNKDAKKTVLLPLLRKCSEQALILRDTSLSVIARHFGSWLQCLRDMLAQSDLRWWLDTYTRILDFANQQMPSSEEKDQKIGQNTAAKNAANNEQLRTACRRMCAYNFPCIVATFGDDQTLFTDKLMPILERFCRDPDEEVRSTVASGFHEILTHRKNCASSKSSNDQEQPQLLNPFVELLSSGSGDVVQQLTANLHLILPVLYKDINAAGNNKKTNAILTKLNQILVSCNSLLRGSGSWRAHEAYLNSLSVLRQLVKPKVLKQSFLPLLKQEVLTARALPCRVAAAQSLLLLMRELPMSKDRQEIIDFFVKEIGQHASCYRRRLLLDIVPPLLQHFSREFFIEKFLHAVLKLSSDPISNIRLQLCRTLSVIKKYLLFPNDDPCLSSLERVVRDLLASEQNPLSRQLIQQSACELSRAETDQKESRANRTKLTEEKRLWTERDDDEEAEEAAQKAKAKKVQEKPKLEGPGSPESGIFFEEDTSWTAQKGTRGLVRSATTANVPEIQHLHSKSTGVTPSSSTDTIAAMAIERPSSSSSSTTTKSSSHSNAMHSYGGTRSRKPPAPPSSSSTSAPSWRNTRPASAAPKLAIVRPQPQVAITQRSCSPMPPAMVDRKGASVEAANCDRNGSSAAAAAAARNSKLPLSTARYRCGIAPNPGTQVQQLASRFMGPANDGTEPVTESLKLKKYKPREIFGQGTTSWSKTPQRMLQQSTTHHSPSRRGAASEGRSTSPSSAMTRSSSAAPAGSGPVPLQTSASSSSLNGRRPYGLMRVQSTSSAVERKPAQIRCHVVSMT